MSNEKCKECKRTLVLDEENLCAYCELNQTQENGESKLNNVNVNCGICKVIVEDDSEGLFCDVCNSWFHNKCNGTPLNYELYALLNDAPDNVKWFCDKCIWETEKWIKEVNNKHQKSGEVERSKEKLNKLKRKFRKEDVQVNKDINVENNENNEEVHTKGLSSSEIQEIKLEINNDCENEYLENEDTHNSSDSDEWVPPAEETEVIKPKPKKKQKKKPSDKPDNIVCDNISTIADSIDAENLLNTLDISPENLASIIDGIRQVKINKVIRLKCNLCPKYFLHLENCIAHKLSYHEGVEKPFKCSDCKHTFETKSNRKRHMHTHLSERKYSCHLCERNFKNHDSVGIHLKKFHSDEKPYSCTVCNYKAKYKNSMDGHMIRCHANETQFQCNICSKFFVNKCSLNYHMSVHSSEKPFACEVCNKTFKSAKNMQTHMTIHSTEKPFECTKCDKKFAIKNGLNIHMLNHVPNEERPYACDQCDSRFNKQSSLKMHKETHKAALKVICDICGKGFRNPHYLKQHEMMHTNERPLKCDICGKGFRHRGHLNLHIKYHKKIVTARCPICGFGAPTKGVLNRHIKLVHTDETQFKCDICGNKYKTKGNLDKHKRGIRGSCKGFNTSNALIEKKRKPKRSHQSYYEQNESKEEESSIDSIPFQETNISTPHMPIMQNHNNHPSLLLYANTHNSNVYATQYHGNLIPSNSRGITAIVRT